MNLLVDQRDMRAADEQAPPPHEFDYEPAPLLEEPIFEESPKDPANDFYEYDRLHKSRRGYFFPVLLIIILITAIITATYFGFFYKSGDLDFVNHLWKKTEQPTRMLPPPGEQPILIDSAVDSQRTVQEIPVTVKPESIAAAIAAPLPGSTTGSRDPLAVFIKAFSMIMSVIPEPIKLNTLVMDESYFSLEVSTENRESMERFYADLKRQVPSELAFSPATGSYGGVRALITGALNTSLPAANASSTHLDATTVSADLRQFAKSFDLSVIEITTLKIIVKNNIRRTPIFVKVRGDRAGFESFVRQISEKSWNIHVAKFILLASKAGASTFVLRLELAQPV